MKVHGKVGNDFLTKRQSQFNRIKTKGEFQVSTYFMDTIILITSVQEYFMNKFTPYTQLVCTLLLEGQFN